MAEWLGWWHDAGKAHPLFQEYLQKCYLEPKKRHTTVDHKGAGTQVAAGQNDLLGFIVHGHHGGLPNREKLIGRFNDLKSGEPGTCARDVLAMPELAALVKAPADPPTALPAWVAANDIFAAEMFVRLLFSSLVDADHLDAERHRNPRDFVLRTPPVSLKELLDKLIADQQQFAGSESHDVLGQLRWEVYQHCLQRATERTGFFRLTAPTGAGKTRSIMAFALAHAIEHHLDRVVVVSPYLTITDQTADVYRGIFGDGVILEHHSDAGRNDDPEGTQSSDAEWRRLTSQTWDASIVVTTSVQIFESLFSNRPSACRKLHRLANSVLIFDEPQTIPTPLLEPICDALRVLASGFGSSVVMCTATQPALEHVPALRDLPPAIELAPDPAKLFSALKRVDYHWPAPGQEQSWAEIAYELDEHRQAMVVVNTRADALELLDATGSQALHLSTYLCGAHRREVLTEVRRRLKEDEPCLLISTQVVEAGVDIDFPVVYRALGPLDRIVQAAGRCNREGTRERGQMVVFEPADGKLPKGSYFTATDTTRSLLSRGPLDPNDPGMFSTYFQLVYQAADLDVKHVQPARRELQFEDVADRFEMIEGGSESVIVRYGGMQFGPADPSVINGTVVDDLLLELNAAIRFGSGRLPRQLLMRLQPYIVSVPKYTLARLKEKPACRQLADGLWIFEAPYGAIRGIGGAIDGHYEANVLMA